MTLRLPTVGFVYLLVTGLGAIWFFWFLIQPAFYQLDYGSPERDLPHARYLIGLAETVDTPRAVPMLNKALGLARKHKDKPLQERVLSALAEATAEATAEKKPAMSSAKAPTGAAGADPQLEQVTEVYPGVLWVKGVDALGWTPGKSWVTLALRNPSAEAHRVELRFESMGAGPGKYAVGSKVTSFQFDGPSELRKGKFELSEVKPGAELELRVWVENPVMVDGVLRGLKFEGMDIKE